MTTEWWKFEMHNTVFSMIYIFTESGGKEMQCKEVMGHDSYYIMLTYRGIPAPA